MKYRLGTTLGVLSQLSAIGLLLTSAWLISRAAEHPPVLYLMVAIVSVRFFGVSRAVLRYAERLATHNGVLGHLIDERVSLYQALNRSAPVGLAGQRLGDVLRRVVSDVDALQDRIVRVRQPRIETIVSSYLTVLVISIIDWRIGLGLLAAVTFSAFVVPLIVDRATAKSMSEVAPAQGEMSGQIVEAMMVANEAIVFGATAKFTNPINQLVTDLENREHRNSQLTGFGSGLVAIAIGAAVVISAVLAVDSANGGWLSPVLIAVVILAPLALWEPLDQLGVVAQIKRQTQSSMERITALRALPASITEPEIPGSLQPAPDILIKDLVVGWSGQPVTNPFSANIAFGSVYAVISPSGGGKSTFAATLARLIEPISGELRIGGVEISHLQSGQVRELVTVLEQEGHLFDTSIRENLRIGDPKATEEQMFAALSNAGLLDFVNTLPDGLDTAVGERGQNLSGGERQRLALARALLAGRQILVLDEPTEFLDFTTAEALLADLLKLRGTHTIIILTHNQRVISAADGVIAIEPIRIV